MGKWSAGLRSSSWTASDTVTALLLATSPAYEDRTLYAEQTGQMQIYAYVKNHCRRKKVFPSRCPVEVYYHNQ